MVILKRVMVILTMGKRVMTILVMFD